MTIVTLSPATDGDDLGTEVSGVGYFAVGGGVGLGIGHGAGAFRTAIRLISTGIPQGATINDASLQLANMAPAGGSSPYGTFYGEDVDSPGAFSSGSLPSTRIAANATSASVTVTGSNYADIDVTAIVQELVNRAGFSGNLALVATPLGSGDYAASTSETLTDYDLVVDYSAGGGGGRTGTLAATESGSDAAAFTGTVSAPSFTPAFSVQHLTPKDIGTSGDTDTITAVDTSSAIALNNNSRLIGGGPDGSAASINVDDASLGVRLTATTTVTYDREAAASGTNRASVSVWEYIGDASGPNEFIVRDRRTVTLTSSDSSSFTPASVSDPTKLIPFITGIRHNDTGTNHGQLTAAAYTNQSTGEVTVYGRAGSGTATIEVTTVEFTGSNWDVHYGTANSANDTGTITLGSSTSDWDDTLIIHQFYKGSAAANHAIADVTPTYVPGIGADEVDWEFNDNHDGNSDQVHVVYALENAGMAVARFSSSDSSAGNVNIDITSAGLTDIDKALVWVSASSSGTGTAHLRGTRNAQLTSTTQAQHYAHRSGNTVAVELQIVKLPQDAASTGSTGTLSATEAGPDAAAATGATSAAGALSSQESGADAAAISGAAAVSAAMAVSEATGDGAALAGGVAVSGALAASEAGSDAAGATGSAQIGAALAAAEGGTDAAAGAGAAPCAGGLAAQEPGPDGATAAGAVAVSGALDATEIGADGFTASGGTDTARTGALAAQESGADATALVGSLPISGDLTAQEADGDTSAATGTLSIAGALVAQEVGGDTFTGTAGADRTGVLAALEIGGDTASVAGATGIFGVMDAVAVGGDAAGVVGVVPVSGALGASEAGGDIAVILGLSTGDDTSSITVAGVWRSYTESGVWSAHAVAGAWASHEIEGAWK